MRRAILPAILALASLAACRTPEADASGYGRYRFMLEISPDATAGFVCIASVTDQMGRGTLTTRPFRVLPGKSGSAVLDEPVSGSRLEATVKVDAAGKRATYQARLVQKEQRTVVYEATKDIPKT